MTLTEPTFELLLTLTHLPKCVCTNNRKTKNVKSELENKGPYEISVNIGWDNFLGVITEKLMVVPSSLVITSFAWLPVQDENGFTSMLKKVKTNVTGPWNECAHACSCTEISSGTGHGLLTDD